MLQGLFIVFLVLVSLRLLSDMLWRAKTPMHESLASYHDPTDGEYLAKMPPCVSKEVALGVRRILVDVGGVETDEVWPETSLVDLLE